MKITITSDYITLGQFLKFAGLIRQGGEAKAYLATHEVLINGELDARRGRKLRPGDVLLLAGQGYEISS